MAVLDDLKNAIENYETDSVKTEVVNFSILGAGNTLNVGETFQFQVKATNQGHIDMKSVTLAALGTEFADVGLSAGPFGASAVSGSFDLPAHQVHTTGFFRGRAKKVTGGVARDIATARINSWNASLDHL